MAGKALAWKIRDLERYMTNFGFQVIFDNLVCIHICVQKNRKLNSLPRYRIKLAVPRLVAPYPSADHKPSVQALDYYPDIH